MIVRARRWKALHALVAAGLLSAVTGCAGNPAHVPSVATFEIEGQQFKIELVTTEQIEHAQHLLAGDEVPGIPVGQIVRNDPSVNEPWSWHIDPETVEFADITTEVCDGLPEYIEDDTLTSDIYCPWGAKLIAIDPLE